MGDKKKILLVEDEENFGALLQNYLMLSNYIVDWEKDGAKGYSAFNKNQYDLCILDVMMPHMDGFTLAEKIRERKPDLPFIFLTARNQKKDTIRGYKLGADDYLNKPFDVEVLLLKLSVILERTDHKNLIELPTNETYQIGEYFFHTTRRELIYGQDEPVKLSPKEAALLKLLCQFMNKVMPREVALKQIWKEDNYFTTRSMDVYLTKLRKHLNRDASISIENLHSSGYQLSVRG